MLLDTMGLIDLLRRRLTKFESLYFSAHGLGYLVDEMEPARILETCQMQLAMLLKFAFGGVVLIGRIDQNDICGRFDKAVVVDASDDRRFADLGMGQQVRFDLDR